MKEAKGNWILKIFENTSGGYFSWINGRQFYQLIFIGGDGGMGVYEKIELNIKKVFRLFASLILSYLIDLFYQFIRIFHNKSYYLSKWFEKRYLRSII